MSEPYFIKAGAIGIIRTYENEPVTLDIYATCAEANPEETDIKDTRTPEEIEADRYKALENLTLDLSVTSAYEDKESYVNHVFGRRLVPDGGLDYELVEVTTLDNRLCNHYKVTVTPLRERYGAAGIKIVIEDYNQEEVEYSEPYSGDESGYIAIYWQRVDASPRMTDLKDVVIGKDRLSGVFEFKVMDEESDSKDLIVDMRPKTEGIIQSIQQTTPLEPIKNGYVRPGWTYKVKGGTEILYSSKIYTAGSTFKGLENYKTWSKTDKSTGEEEVFEIDGITRAYQIMPEQGATGSTEVEVTIADRMTVDYYDVIHYLGFAKHFKTIYDGESFWVADAQGYGVIQPDPYADVINWGQKYVATGTVHRDMVIGTVSAGTFIVTVGYGTVTFSGEEEGEPDVIKPLAYICFGRFPEVKVPTGALTPVFKDKNGNYLYDVAFYGVSYGASEMATDTRFVAVGTKKVNGVTYGVVYSSKDVRNWEEEAILDAGAVLQCVDYSNGYFVAAGYKEGYGTVIYSSSKEGVWKEINQTFSRRVFALDSTSPEYYIDDVTSLTHLGDTFILTGSVRHKVSGGYVPDAYSTVVMYGSAYGDWTAEKIPWGRGWLVGLTNAGDFVLGVGNDYTAVLITPDMRFYNQWYTNKDTVPTSPYVLNSVAFGGGLIFGVGDGRIGFLSSTSIRLTEGSFVTTVTDWWESKDFLPSAIREHPLFAKTAELLDYLVTQGHIQNMIKVDNLYEGKSIHFDENYLTNLLTDDSFRALDIAQDNKETLAVIAANIYNIKGTVRGLKYMLSLLSVAGQTLDADVYDWVYVNKNLEEFNLAQPLDACTVLVKVKVPLSIHLDEALEHRLVEIMQSFFWICANIVFNWTRTIETDVEFHDLFDAQEEIPPFEDSWPFGRPFDLLKYDDMEGWVDIVSVFEDSIGDISWEADLATPVDIKEDLGVYDGLAFRNSWLDTQEPTDDDILIDTKLWCREWVNENSDSWSDYFDWVSADIDWQTSFEVWDLFSLEESSGFITELSDEVEIDVVLEMDFPMSFSDWTESVEDSVEFDIEPFIEDALDISWCSMGTVWVSLEGWSDEVTIDGDILTMEEQVTSWAESFPDAIVSYDMDLSLDEWIDYAFEGSVYLWEDTKVGGGSDGMFVTSVIYDDELDISADWGIYHSDYFPVSDGHVDFTSGMKVELDDELEITSWLLIAYITTYPEYGIDLIWGSFEYGTEEYEVRILS